MYFKSFFVYILLFSFSSSLAIRSPEFIASAGLIWSSSKAVSNSSPQAVELADPILIIQKIQQGAAHESILFQRAINDLEEHINNAKNTAEGKEKLVNLLMEKRAFEEARDRAKEQIREGRRLVKKIQEKMATLPLNL